MRALLATAYAFGFRREELLDMRVKQISLIDRAITLYRGETKSGEPRLVKMTEDVLLLLTECVRGKGPEDYVFTRDGQHIVDTRDARSIEAARKIEQRQKRGKLFPAPEFGYSSAKVGTSYNA